VTDAFMTAETTVAFEFGPFRLEPRERQLLRSGRPVALTPKAFETLQALVVRGGRAVSKDELMRTVWPDTNVSDATLAQNVFAVRKALGDADCIETVPKFGYRFVPAVRELPVVARKIALAVLPFDNLNGPEQNFFSDGLTEEMITELSRLSADRLSVVGRTSTMLYKGARKTIAEVGRELGVAYVLEGSVRRVGQRVRISAQLIQTSDQTHVWAEGYERNLDDVLSLQCEVARAVAREIRVTLTPQHEARLARPRPIDPKAYEAYLKGRYFWNRRTRDALEKSVECFREATSVDPGYAAAYAGLADCYLRMLDYGHLPPREASALANAAALKALAIDEMQAEAHTSLGHRSFHEFDWRGAQASFERALSINPGYDTAHYYCANLLAAIGRFDDAIREARRALELDPVAVSVILNAAFISHLARRPADAHAFVDKALDIDPHFAHAHYHRGLIYALEGLYDKAIDSFEKALGRGPGSIAALAHACAMAGRRDDARRLLQTLLDRMPTAYVSSFDVALVLVGLDERAQAFEWFDKAYEERAAGLAFVRSDPRFESLTSDRRFHRLLYRLGFSSVSPLG